VRRGGRGDPPAGGDLGSAELLATARSLLAELRPAPPGLWPRTAAHLARQALEQVVRRVLARRAPGLETTSMRAQLICLPEYLGDLDLGGRVGHVWAALSNACHHHAYELAPTATELRAWLGAVEALAEAVARREEGERPSPARRDRG
jgi:hypothetical protein